MAIAAGANLILGPMTFVLESKLNMLSPTGRSRMWDAGADGYARGVCHLFRHWGLIVRLSQC
jgi:acyl transferase domain-containing protein